MPRFSWTHDVTGTSPGRAAISSKAATRLTLGVAANLRAHLGVDVSWTEFGGAGRFNDLNDRDFVAASVK